MRHRVTTLSLASLVRGLAPQARIALYQVPLLLFVGVLAITAPFAWPSAAASGVFAAGAALVLLLFLACFALPWGRLPARAPLLVPTADFLAIALMVLGAGGEVGGMVLLALFPVIWISGDGLRLWQSAPLSFAGTWLVELLPTAVAALGGDASGAPPAAQGPGWFAASLLRPSVLAVVSLAVGYASENARTDHQALTRKDAELRTLLAKTEAKEELLNSILGTIDVGVCVFDGDGRLVLANQAMHDLWARTGGNPASGAPPQPPPLWCADRATPLDPDESPGRRAARGEVFGGYLIWAGPEDSQVALVTSSRPLAAPAAGALVVYQDVTGLVEALRAKDEFVAAASHDFRAPLTSVVGNLELVIDGGADLPETERRRLDAALRSTDRLLALVEDLLVTTSGAATMARRPSDLGVIAETSLSMAGPAAEKAGVRLRLEADESAWAEVDPLRMSRVFDNLVGNAIKYSPDGGTVTVSVFPAGAAVRIEVADEGQGMDPDECAHVFRRFYRTGRARGSRVGGMGLGLAICKSIVEAHDGAIRCSSEPGRGSVFTVDVPRCEVPAEMAAGG